MVMCKVVFDSQVVCAIGGQRRPVLDTSTLSRVLNLLLTMYMGCVMSSMV